MKANFKSLLMNNNKNSFEIIETNDKIIETNDKIKYI